MPGSDKYYPPTDKLRDGFNAEIVSERNRRYTTYRAALRYYMGIQPEQLEEIDTERPDMVLIWISSLTICLIVLP